ncbi:MAG: hypothetical protein GC168_02665 [Candidatus Hydrogenedens sp.]|nr:hypothetical protein [Candidatus Hydrogenedens sp.]
MSEDSVVETPAPVVPAPVDAGPSWLTVFAGLSFAATLAVLAGVVAVRFGQGRPVNLSEPSARVAELVQDSLRDQFIPRDAITIESSRQDEDDGDYWTHYDFDVVLPQRLDPEGVARLVREDLEKYKVTVQQGDDPGALSVWLSNYQVASLRLQAAPAPVTGKTDFRVASAKLAEDVRDALSAAGVESGALYVGPPSPREDNDARWYQTEVEATLPKGLTAEGVLAAISGSVSFSDALVRQGSSSSDALPVEVLYRDRLCVQLLCSLSPRPGQPSELPAPGNEPGLAETVDEALELAPAPTTMETPMAAPVPTETPEPPADSDAAAMARQQVSLAPVPPPARNVLPDAEDPVMALILDDGGYGGMVTERVLKLDPKVTLSILPNTPYGTDTAKRAEAAGFQVMLHMPMETNSSTIEPFPGQISTGMGRDEIKKLTLAALDQVPGAIGSNNHTGSKFTADPMRMEMYLEIMKAKNLFFVDSVTEVDSKAYAVAEEMQVPAGRRDVFLDDDPDPAKIRQQFAEAVRVAKRKGQVIVIGHFREGTLDVLEQELPKLADAGVRLVPVSELVK